MVNPYFNAVYYLQQNPDVLDAGFNVDTAWNHYVTYGALEGYEAGGMVRAPTPWFDVGFYLSSYADLTAAGVTPPMAFSQFTNYGMSVLEGRAPSSEIAASPITEASLLEYFAANVDLQEAFGILPDAVSLTTAQEQQLVSHFYMFGYAEDRAAPPTVVTLPEPESIAITGVLDAEFTL